jgi:hypothetical protein
MACKVVWVVLAAAWMLWQEMLLPNTPREPSWHLDSRFSEESACNEVRRVRIIEQLLRAGTDGMIITNQPTIQDGTIWLQDANGGRTRIRFFCLPETIDPRDTWGSLLARIVRLEMPAQRSCPFDSQISF